MRPQVQEIPNDISQSPYAILFAWFIANPNGPTAFTIGTIEAEGSKAIFYRWLHFTRSRTWLIGRVDQDCDPLSPEFASAVRLALQQAHVDFIRSEGDEQPFLTGLPSFAIAPSNEHLSEAFLRFALPILDEREWGDEFHAMSLHGPAFFNRAAHQARAMYEAFKAKGESKLEFLEFMWAQHGGKAPFLEWQPRNGPPLRLDWDKLVTWYNAIISREYVSNGARDFALMWAGATATVGNGLVREVRADGTYVSFERMAAFLRQGGMPLFPQTWTDEWLCEQLGVSRAHL